MVTVFFEAELDLVRLQARSLNALGRGAEFARIIVIDNTYRGISAHDRSRLLADFGHFRDRVIVVRPADLVDLPEMPGWVGQQVLKVMVHRMVETSHYVVLDAKNHWIQPTDLSVFINPDGRSRGASHTYRGHALEHQVAEVMRYLGVDPEKWIDHFLVTHTPVVMETKIVSEMVEGIESRSGREFALEFRERNLLEFPLYASWIIANHGGLESHVDGSVVRSTTIWPSADSSTIKSSLAMLAGDDRLDSPFLAIHRKALARADRPSAQLISNFWVDCGLFPTRWSALHFIYAFKLNYAFTMSVRKLRGLLG